MKNLFTLLAIIIFCFSMQAQRNLFRMKYKSLATDFNLNETELEAYRNEGKLVIFNTEKHKTNLAKKLIESKIGKTKKIDNGYYKTSYKVLSKVQIPHYRVRYIFIDKNKFKDNLTLENYKENIRNLLEDKAFKSVAMQYSMDYKKHVGGDSGWFKEGKTQPDFFNNATQNNRLAEEIFEFENDKAYYIVQNTHAPMDIEEVLVLEIKED